MNVKEISLAVSKPERTVHNWVKKSSAKMAQVSAKMAQAKKTSIPADYDLEETCFIIEQGLGKNASNLFRSNATSANIAPISAKMAQPENILSERDKEIISQTVSATIKSLIPYLNQSVSVPTKKENQIAFNPKALRSDLRMIINKYTQERGCDYKDSWNQLYQDIYYKLDRNVRLCANNRGIETLDYIEQEGLMEEVLEIAKKRFTI
jgi:hypothetical protein